MKFSILISILFGFYIPDLQSQSISSTLTPTETSIFSVPYTSNTNVFEPIWNSYKLTIFVSVPSLESITDPMSYFEVRQNELCKLTNGSSVWIEQVIPLDSNLTAYNLTRNSTVNILPYSCDLIPGSQFLQTSYKVKLILVVNTTLSIAGSSDSNTSSNLTSILIGIGSIAALFLSCMGFLSLRKTKRNKRMVNLCIDFIKNFCDAYFDDDDEDAKNKPKENQTDDENKNKPQKNSVKKDCICYRCGRTGHYKRDCYASKHIKGYDL